MAAKKGHSKAGGRKKGTPNKVTADLRTWVSALIDGNRETIETDLKLIDPKERLVILERLMAFVIPKMQSIDATVQIAEEYKQLEQLLQSAPDVAVEKIVDKVMELSNQKTQQNEKK